MASDVANAPNQAELLANIRASVERWINTSDTPEMESRRTGKNIGPNEIKDNGEALMADTRLMSYPIYQQLLHRRFPQRWPETPPAETPTAAFDRRYLMYEVSELVRSNAVYYLHPSFGYYFELLYLRPHGLVYHLAPYGTNLVTPPALTERFSSSQA